MKKLWISILVVLTTIGFAGCIYNGQNKDNGKDSAGQSSQIESDSSEDLDSDSFDTGNSSDEANNSNTGSSSDEEDSFDTGSSSEEEDSSDTGSSNDEENSSDTGNSSDEGDSSNSGNSPPNGTAVPPITDGGNFDGTV